MDDNKNDNSHIAPTHRKHESHKADFHSNAHESNSHRKHESHKADFHSNEFPVYNFGWWPEIVGIAGVVLLIWFLITFAGGSI